ncbi:hypothetical protein Zmor_013719 [Zophobas morio]|uniref:Gustatory receptor n=1 Tax=Zophobas morio TaxID=2755281 RepID=A0AA38IDZ3_9CUCU|nr:hypothetical protein Zmor_013719 [Zophobas morio]
MGITRITTNLKRKLNILSVMFTFLATVEHILIKCYLFREIMRKCGLSDERSKQVLIHTHFFIFYYISKYSLWKGIFFQLIVIRSTFSWTFIDVFIMLITTAFALRVKQFASKVEILMKSKNDIEDWKKLRQEHYQLYQLCCLLNDRLTYIIFVSYGTNLYFILIQLFGSIKHLTNTLRKGYYYMSFVLLIARLLGVTLFGATVGNESKKILPLLFSVPSSSYNKEVERLIDQVVKNEIVVSVKNYFKITKALLFKFTGVLVTYELVLIQFNTYSLYTDSTAEFDKCWLFTNST